MAGGLINTQLPAICFFITVENGIIHEKGGIALFVHKKS